MKAKHYFLLVAFTAVSFGLKAQDQTETEPKQKVKIHVKITENGETKEITREVESDSEVNVDSILRELGVMEGMELTSRGQQIEVDIKKKSAGVGEDRDISVNVMGPHGMRFHHAPSAVAEVKSRAFMGVYIEDLDADDAQEMGLKDARGAYITSVIEGTGAEKAGLEEGTVITKVDGEQIDDYEELVDIVRAHKPGDVVEVETYSDGHFNTTSVELGEKKMEKRVAIAAPDIHWDFDTEDFDPEYFNSEEFQEKMKELGQKMEEMGQKFEWHGDEGDFGFDFDFDFDDMPGVNKAFLGIVPSGNEVEAGVKIGTVVEGSAAEEMGLEKGDIIQALNGEEIDDFDDLVEMLGEHEPGDDIQIDFERDGAMVSQKGTLKSRADSHHNVMRWHQSPYKVEKEVKVFIEIADISEEEAEELNSATTGVDVKTESDLTIRSLQFAPNPNDGDFNLSFDLPNIGNTEIRVYDGNGRQVYYEMLGNFSGKYSNRINISDEPNGIYFLLITQGEQQFSKKIIKQ